MDLLQAGITQGLLFLFVVVDVVVVGGGDVVVVDVVVVIVVAGAVGAVVATFAVAVEGTQIWIHTVMANLCRTL